MQEEQLRRYRTAGGIQVIRRQVAVDYSNATDTLVDELNCYQGVLLSSGFDYPGRYQRWDVGFVRPPLRLVARRRSMDIEALNARGRVLLPALKAALQDCGAVDSLSGDDSRLQLQIRPPQPLIYEEQRSRQHTVFSVLREIMALFSDPDDKHLGLYGTFGYELAFQFEAIEERLERDIRQRDLVLYIPDELLVVDHQKEEACRCSYDFFVGELSTLPLPRSGIAQAFVPAGMGAGGGEESCDHEPGEYADTVRSAIEHFRRGDLFEAVPGQVFFAPCRDQPGDIFRRLKKANPAPYGVLMNLGDGEYLVGASPEMYVRVREGRVETCPISGTIARGLDALEDAEQILTLLNSGKDLAELSMCTDVDRNDKARVCEPGSVKVIGRRQIEMYSRLIHTVDHVEGRLKPQMDALDAFLSHTWAVTVTGAPKQAAIQFIEDHEKSPRRWYGGAMGFIGFNGHMNTGLTLRTMRIADGVAEIRAGATLLFDSDPAAEERETRLKASALLSAVRNDPVQRPAAAATVVSPARQCRILMVDHHDSFVHNLAAYFQVLGASVSTVRPAHVALALRKDRPELVVLSPGPGRPVDFQLAQTIRLVLAEGLPLFGVCLGLQGIVEYFGGSLAQLDYPMHGKASGVRVEQTEAGSALFADMDHRFEVGRYHSLVAMTVPDCLRVTARTEEGVVMAVEHRSLPVAAVQFHPESILSLGGGGGGNGSRVLANVLMSLVTESVYDVATFGAPDNE